MRWLRLFSLAGLVFLSVALSCGGESEKIVAAQPNESRDSAPSSTEGTEAAMARPEERDVMPESQVNFTLYVSNQSSTIPEVDISVRIDNQLVVNDVFSIGSGHNVVEHSLSLSEGTHRVVAVSEAGEARFEGTFKIDDRAWANLMFWYESGAGATPRALAFEISDKPGAFR